MASLPYMPLWIDALNNDTYHLTATEFGAYVRILGRIWTSKSLSVRNCPKHLARVAQVPPNHWDRVSQHIFDLDGWVEDSAAGTITHARLVKEWENSQARHQQRVEAGKRSAEAKKSVNAIQGQTVNAKQAQTITTKNINEINDDAPTDVATRLQQSEPEPEILLSPVGDSSGEAINRSPNEPKAAHEISLTEGMRRKAFALGLEPEFEYQEFIAWNTRRGAQRTIRGWNQCWASHLKRKAKRLVEKSRGNQNGQRKRRITHDEAIAKLDGKLRRRGRGITINQ